jgi:hypothetical protein
VTALAAGPDRALAIACDDGSIVIDGGKHADKRSRRRASATSPARLRWRSTARSLLVAQGSARHRASDWAVDLMEKNAGGSVWRVDLETGAAQRLAGDLAFPYGILIRASASWWRRAGAIAWSRSRARAARRNRC